MGAARPSKGYDKSQLKYPQMSLFTVSIIPAEHKVPTDI